MSNRPSGRTPTCCRSKSTCNPPRVHYSNYSHHRHPFRIVSQLIYCRLACINYYVASLGVCSVTVDWRSTATEHHWLFGTSMDPSPVLSSIDNSAWTMVCSSSLSLSLSLSDKLVSVADLTVINTVFMVLPRFTVLVCMSMRCAVDLTLWRPLMPYSYKASWATPG